jgi:hypothetical protein
VSGQFRYGSAQKTQGFNTLANFETIVIPNGTTFVGTLTNNEKIRDEHWVVDFAIGRDFGLGNANAQWKLGLRVVDLRARLTASGISKQPDPWLIMILLLPNKTRPSSAPDRASASRARPH